MVEKNARLASKTEELAGRCRRLAIALDTYADSRGFLRAGERKFIRGIAVALTEIAEEMTVALAAGDVEAVKRASSWARRVAVPFVLVALATAVADIPAAAVVDAATSRATWVDDVGADIWIDDPIIEQRAQQLLETSQELSTMIQDSGAQPRRRRCDECRTPNASAVGRATCWSGVDVARCPRSKGQHQTELNAVREYARSHKDAVEAARAAHLYLRPKL